MKHEKTKTIHGHKVQIRELKRKSIHVLFGIAFLLMIAIAGTNFSIQVISICLLLGILVSTMVKKGVHFGFINRVVEGVERDEEKKFPGKAAVLFFTSALVLLLLNYLGIFGSGNSIVLAALGVQIFADASAALFGMTFGKHKLYHKKTWEGSIACFIVATACIAVFFPIHIALIGAFVATAVEVLPLDDNLWVPLFTATAIKLLI